MLLCLLNYPTFFGEAFLPLLEKPLNFFDGCLSHSVRNIVCADIDYGAVIDRMAFITFMNADHNDCFVRLGQCWITLELHYSYFWDYWRID